MFLKSIASGIQKDVGIHSRAWLLPDCVGQAGHFGVTHLKPHDALPINAHTYDEIFYIIEGSALISISSEEQIAEAGSVIFIPKGAYHFVTAQESLLKMLFINMDAEK